MTLTGGFTTRGRFLKATRFNEEATGLVHPHLGARGGGCAIEEGFRPADGSGGGAPLSRSDVTPSSNLSPQLGWTGRQTWQSTPPCVQLGSLEALRQERQLSREWWDRKRAPGAARRAGSADMKSSLCLGRALS